MKKQTFLELIDRYQKNQASLAEKVLVEEYLRNLETDHLIHLTAEEEVVLKRRMKLNIDDVLQTAGPWRNRKLQIIRYAAAAILLLVAGYGLFFVSGQGDRGPVKDAAKLITAGSNKALLTLANGSTIELNDVDAGDLARQGNVTVSKTKDGKLIYQVSGNGVETETGNNMVSTPRGGQYQVILPDQTHVWLNAASSITFPAAFTGNARNVSITGEAYFEVAHDARRPFTVSTGKGLAVEVLGTHFNVNAYDDEPLVSATLLSGSVRVSASSASKIIEPGEQAQIAVNQGSKINIVHINTANVVAWKDDLFVFENEDIQTAMRRIARWYNIDISYPNGVPKKTIGGTISRFKDVAELLKLIELTGGVKFKIEGRRVLVMS